MARISFFIEDGLILDMMLEQQTRLKTAIETAIQRNIAKEWNKKQYEAKIVEMQKALAAL